MLQQNLPAPRKPAIPNKGEKYCRDEVTASGDLFNYFSKTIQIRMDLLTKGGIKSLEENRMRSG